MSEDPPGPLSAGPAPAPERSRRRRSPARRAAYALAAPLVSGGLRGLFASYRKRLARESPRAMEVVREGKPIVLVFWHEQLVLGTSFAHATFGEHLRFAYLVSPSVDGDVAARILEKRGAEVVRGSATRSGVKSLKELYRALQRRGASPIITPDGPRGPVRRTKPGALVLSQMAGVPMIPIAAVATPEWRLRTWDRLCLPPPFARVAFAIGDPVEAPSDTSTEVQDAECARMDGILDELTACAASALREPR